MHCWQLNRCPKYTLSLWQSFLVGLALFSVLFYREMMWKLLQPYDPVKNPISHDDFWDHEEESFDFVKCVLIAFWISIVLIALNQYGALIHNIFWSHRKTSTTNSTAQKHKSSTTPSSKLCSRFSLAQNLYTKFTCLMLIFALLHRPQSVILLPSLIYILERGYHLCDALFGSQITISKYQHYQKWLMKTVLTVFVGEMFYYCQVI